MKNLLETKGFVTKFVNELETGYDKNAIHLVISNILYFSFMLFFSLVVKSFFHINHEYVFLIFGLFLLFAAFFIIVLWIYRAKEEPDIYTKVHEKVDKFYLTIVKSFSVAINNIFLFVLIRTIFNF